MMHVVVVEIATGRGYYSGPCLHTAATHLDPGTCYGVAETPEQALERAKSRAEMFRDTGYEGP